MLAGLCEVGVGLPARVYLREDNHTRRGHIPHSPFPSRPLPACGAETGRAERKRSAEKLAL